MTFEKTDPHLGPGGQVSTRQHPCQSFQWADYSAKERHDYTYRVVALYGTPLHRRVVSETRPLVVAGRVPTKKVPDPTLRGEAVRHAVADVLDEK